MRTPTCTWMQPQRPLPQLATPTATTITPPTPSFNLNRPQSTSTNPSINLVAAPQHMQPAASQSVGSGAAADGGSDGNGNRNPACSTATSDVGCWCLDTHTLTSARGARLVCVVGHSAGSRLSGTLHLACWCWSDGRGRNAGSEGAS